LSVGCKKITNKTALVAFTVLSTRAQCTDRFNTVSKESARIIPQSGWHRLLLLLLLWALMSTIKLLLMPLCCALPLVSNPAVEGTHSSIPVIIISNLSRKSVAVHHPVSIGLDWTELDWTFAALYLCLSLSVC